jgi:hypothetical protein
VFWGLIGPNKLFSSGAMYNSMLWFFLVGAVLPAVIWYASKRFPNTFVSKLHAPLMMSTAAAIPPATAANYMPWAIVGLFFNWYLKRRAQGWWLKYNYILSAGLDAGLAVTTLLIFLCLYYPGVTLEWWGNTVDSTTADAAGLPLLTVSAGETFGPSTWK